MTISVALRSLKRYTNRATTLIIILFTALLFFILESIVLSIYDRYRIFIVFILAVCCNYVFYRYISKSERCIKKFAETNKIKSLDSESNNYCTLYYYFYKHEIYNYYKNNNIFKSILIVELLSLFLSICYIILYAYMTKNRWLAMCYYILLSFVIIKPMIIKFMSLLESIDNCKSKKRNEEEQF